MLRPRNIASKDKESSVNVQGKLEGSKFDTTPTLSDPSVKTQKYGE